MEEKKIKPKREPMPGLKGMVWLWSSGIPLSRSLPEMLYLYWLEASTMSPGWQPHHTWVGAFGVNEIQWNCNWQMPKSVADSPRPPACLLPSTSAQALCQPFAKNASSGKKEQPSRGPPGSALRMRTSPFLREFQENSPICPPPRWTCSLGKIKSLFSLPSVGSTVTVLNLKRKLIGINLLQWKPHVKTRQKLSEIANKEFF